MSNYVTIKVSEYLLEEMKDYYKDYLINDDGEYIYFSAIYHGLEIKGYQSKKINKSVVFNGDNALLEARKWDPTAEISRLTKTEDKSWICLDNQIGSDEVGVSDFVLPMIVVAAFVRAQDIDLLKSFGVTDSKKLSDDTILQIGEKLKTKFFFSKLTLSNVKYNEMIEKGENLNSLKAKMHNRALTNLFKKFPDTTHIFIDQFVGIDKYYSYLNDKNEFKLGNITFHTKGESYYPSVALASVMARYSFLKEKEKLEEHYQMTFPFGAGNAADQFAKKFIDKYGLEEFNKIAKKNFANYRSIINEKKLLNYDDLSEEKINQ